MPKLPNVNDLKEKLTDLKKAGDKFAKKSGAGGLLDKFKSLINSPTSSSDKAPTADSSNDGPISQQINALSALCDSIESNHKQQSSAISDMKKQLQQLKQAVSAIESKPKKPDTKNKPKAKETKKETKEPADQSKATKDKPKS